MGKISLLPRHYLNVDDHPRAIIVRGMLLVGGQKLRTRRACGHRGIGVGHAELLEFARRPRQPVVLIQISQIDRIQMLGDQRAKADIGPDQSGIHMHDIPETIPAVRQSFTTRAKIARNRSEPHLCRIRVSEEWSGSASDMP